ncbi:MAG: PD-(D/E)XK nuclease family protein, partial [Rhodothermales bacterium]|nr:PD-(D/E)XK nuclease family protein [Rhodothermales bacterium]
SYSDGIPIAQTFAGQSLIRYLRWLAGGLKSEDLAVLANGGYLTFQQIDGVKDLYPDRLGTFLIRRNVGSGLDESLSALAIWKTSLERSRYPSDRDIKLAAELDVAIRALYKSVPDGAVVTSGEVAAAAISFMKRFVRVKSDQDRAAVNLLCEPLQRLTGSRATGTVEDMAGFLVDMLRHRRTNRSAALPGSIHIVPLEKSGYAGRKHVAAIGFDGQVFPGSSRSEPVLLDSERESLSSDLPTSVRDQKSRLAALTGVVARTTESITVTYSMLDPIFGRELDPATALDAMLEERGVRPTRHGLGAAIGFLTDSGAVLSQMHGREFGTYADSHFPWLSSGFHAGQERAQNPFSEYSGFVRGRTPELDIRSSDKVVSPSSLERLVRCPYLYFVRDVLKVRPPDKIDRRPGRWLSALEFGNLLHQLFFEFMTELAKRGERPDEAKHRALLQSMLDDKIVEWQDAVPSAGVVALERERFLLSQAIDVFLGSETRRSAEPYAFEAGFGESSDSTARLVLDDDVAFRLRGSIDRVDVGPEGFEIWDYKSGQSASFRADLNEDPLHLQWALYAYVWSDFLSDQSDRPVARSGYFFTSGAAFGERISSQPPDRSVLADRLRPLMEMTAAGAFPHLQVAKQDACAFCDYKNICGTECVKPKEMVPQEMFATHLPEGAEAVRKWAES